LWHYTERDANPKSRCPVTQSIFKPDAIWIRSQLGWYDDVSVFSHISAVLRRLWSDKQDMYSERTETRVGLYVCGDGNRRHQTSWDEEHKDYSHNQKEPIRRVFRYKEWYRAVMANFQLVSADLGSTPPQIPTLYSSRKTKLHAKHRGSTRHSNGPPLPLGLPAHLHRLRHYFRERRHSFVLILFTKRASYCTDVTAIKRTVFERVWTHLGFCWHARFENLLIYTVSLYSALQHISSFWIRVS
jgi:hypothetical protein